MNSNFLCFFPFFFIHSLGQQMFENTCPLTSENLQYNKEKDMQQHKIQCDKS